MNDAPTNGFGLPLAARSTTAPAATPALAVVPLAAPAAPSAPAAPVVPTGAPAAAPIHLSLDDLLIHVLRVGASDLHLTAGAPPTVRLRGEL